MGLQDHANAYLQLLRDVPGLTVYPAADGAPGSAGGIVPPRAPMPYIAAHFVADRTSGDRLDMRSTRMVVRGYIHCVGATESASRAVADQVAEALLDVVPAIDGRTCFPIRHDASQPPRPDETTGQLVVDLVDVYRLETMPS